MNSSKKHQGSIYQTHECPRPNIFLSSISYYIQGNCRDIAFLEIRNGEVLQKVLSAGTELTSLKLNGEFVEKKGASDRPYGFLRLLHYPGEMVLLMRKWYMVHLCIPTME